MHKRSNSYLTNNNNNEKGHSPYISSNIKRKKIKKIFKKKIKKT